MDSRLATVESIVGEHVECGGLFKLARGGFRRSAPRFGMFGLLELGSTYLGYRFRHRSQPKWPGYLVLALTGDTLFVFAAGLALGDVGPVLGRFARADVS